MSLNRRGARRCPLNWNLIQGIDPTVLLRTRDPASIARLTDAFLTADYLFEDPSRCPPDLVNRLFDLMKIVLSERIAEIERLGQTPTRPADYVNPKQSSQSTHYVFQCLHCPKVFQSRDYLMAHMQRRHSLVSSSYNHPQFVSGRSADPGPPREVNTFKSEVSDMLEHIDLVVAQPTDDIQRERGEIRHSKGRSRKEQKKNTKPARRLPSDDSMADFSSEPVPNRMGLRKIG
jgi:hypothetical protein